jgi:hypothetical protein
MLRDDPDGSPDLGTMIYDFDDFTLDLRRFELSRRASLYPSSPRCSTTALLVSTDRLVTR